MGDPKLAWEEVAEECYEGWEPVATEMKDRCRWGHWELHVFKHNETGTLVGFDVQVTSGDEGGWECYDEFGFPVEAIQTTTYRKVKAKK